MSEHVRAGGSRIHRIIACPGSLQAPESQAGDAAAKGTTAHHVGEQCIVNNLSPEDFLGQTILGHVVDRKMVDAVSIYVHWVRGIVQPLVDAGIEFHLFVERQVDWATLKPPEPMRGSADVIIVVPSMALMVVGDYKNGTEWVEHAGNKQTRYYATGALVSLPREIAQHVRKVQMTIIQPNVPGIDDDQAVRSETIDVGELIDFAGDAIEAVTLGQKPDAPRKSGKHCKYCSLAGSCRTRAEHSTVEAQTEFEILVPVAAAVQIDSVPIEQLAVMVGQAEDIEARVSRWVKDAKERLERELKAGVDVPGWKMVAKRASRVWNDEMAVEVWASRQGLKSDDIYEPRVLKSPAQMEEVVGKKKLPADLYSKVSSGFNLARATSHKAAVGISAGDEFETVKP